MVDPLSSLIRTAVTQRSLSGGLQALLQSGAQRGQVQQHNSGQLFVNIKGFQLPLSSTSGSLQAGQFVNIQLQGGQILIEPLLSQTASQSNFSAETARTISTILSQMGIQNPQAEVIAQAMLQSNIPLNRSVLQELVQIFPQLHPESMQALIFLISRRIPLSESMLFWVSRLFSRRENSGKLAQSITNDIGELQEQVGGLDIENVGQIQSGLGGFQQNLKQEFLPLEEESMDELDEDVKQALSKALVSAEAIFSGGTRFDHHLAETVSRLLSFLMALQQQYEAMGKLPLFQELLAKVEALQETLAVQSLENLPEHDTEHPPSFFVKMPIWKDHEADQLEIMFKRIDADQKSGSVDLRFELSKLGPLHARIGWQHPTINIVIHVEDLSIARYLNEHVDVLKKGLRQAGFQTGRIEASQHEVPSTLQPVGANSLHTNLSGIDLRV